MDRLTAAWLIVLVCACGKGKERSKAKPGSASSPTPAATAKLGRAIDVAVTQSQVCAVLASGQVACWGDQKGSLEPLTPRPTIVKGVTDATSIGAERCVLRGAKPAMCWDNEAAVREIPGTENARQLAHGEWEPCFVLANGSVSCWDERAARLAPVSALTGVRSLDDWGYNEWCYVRDKDGAIVCTGDHESDLGKQLPVFPDAISVSRVEQSIACAARKSGELSCFGTYADAIAKLPTTGDQIFLEGLTACMRRGGDIACRPWAEETWNARALPAKATKLSCDSNTCCAVLADGGVACWGDNGEARLGDGVAASATTPAKVDKLPPVATLMAGERFSIALTREDGDLYAWGGFGKGPHVPSKIASGPIVSVAVSGSLVIVARESSMRVMESDGERWDSESLPAPPAKPRSISVDEAGNMCAALDDGMTYCARPDATGEELRWMPIRGFSNIKELSAGGASTCGVSKTGTVACMIDERSEDETKPPPRSAVLVPGIKNARHLANPFAELADGTSVQIRLDEKRRWIVTPSPTLAGLSNISTGGYGWSPTCAIKDTRARCWFAFGGGDDRMGVLARETGSTVPTGTPAPVAGAIDAVAVAAGNSHACLLDAAGAVWCWGDDRYGSLGRGRYTWRDEPVRVVDIGP